MQNENKSRMHNKLKKCHFKKEKGHFEFDGSTKNYQIKLGQGHVYH